MLKKLLVGKTGSGKAQFVRSILVSNVSFALDFCVCLLLVGRLKLNYLAATALSFTAGTALNYALSVLWVFDERPVENRRLEFGFYLFIAALGLGLNALSMLFFTGLLHVHYLVSRVLSASLVFFFNYFARKKLLFSQSRFAAIAERLGHFRG
jgi:putative flippase GtrA